MRSCAGEGQDEYIFVFLVYQQPFWGDVALSVSEPISFKRDVGLTSYITKN